MNATRKLIAFGVAFEQNKGQTKKKGVLEKLFELAFCQKTTEINEHENTSEAYICNIAQEFYKIIKERFLFIVIHVECERFQVSLEIPFFSERIIRMERIASLKTALPNARIELFDSQPDLFALEKDALDLLMDRTGRPSCIPWQIENVSYKEELVLRIYSFVIFPKRIRLDRELSFIAFERLT